jgi:hypothetical protein
MTSMFEGLTDAFGAFFSTIVGFLLLIALGPFLLHLAGLLLIFLLGAPLWIVVALLFGLH